MRQPGPKRTDTLLPDTTLVRSADVHAQDATELVEVIFADPVRHDIVALRQDENIESVEGRGIAVDRRAGHDVHLPEMQTRIITTVTAVVIGEARPSAPDVDCGALVAKTAGNPVADAACAAHRSEEHTSELQSLMRIPYAVLCLNKKKTQK